MMIKSNRSIALLLVLLLFTVSTSQGQSTGRKVIDERNVRAQMNFLASDALQGRGSGTVFERIAAEYVGSQFMQFGLEAAGEPGWDGKSSYVQSVSSTRNSFSEPPVVKVAEQAFTHGREVIVLRANQSSITGNLQKSWSADKTSPGSAVLLKLPDGSTGNPVQAMQAVITAGASIVMVEETPDLRASWANLAARRLTFTLSPSGSKPAAMLVLGKEAAATLAAMSDGTRLELSGKLSPPEVRTTWNAIGKLNGTDVNAGNLLISSHLDHLGVRENDTGPDKIFNGADDDASGTVAVMELARTLASGKRPKRTIYFVCFGSEEAGGMGSNYFANNMPFPKEQLVANLQFEMIGRPDPKVKPQELWLTGYERSNLGSELAKRGAKLVQDPHPSQNFFQRSDNYTLAREGIIAHTVSSFGLHSDYHRASDELKTIDFVHMTRSIESMIAPIQWLINSDFRPTWHEGKKP